MTDQYDQVRSLVHNAIQTAYAQHAPDDNPLKQGMLQNWMLMSEWISADGDRYLDTLTATDTRIWEMMGWAQYVLNDCAEQQLQPRDD